MIDPGLVADVHRMLVHRCGVGEGEHVLVACSGGRDSAVLLDVLSELREPLGISLSAATVDHGLRDGFDEEADAARQICRARDIPWRLRTVRVPAEDRKRLGTEAAARAARRRSLLREAERNGADAIALGHHRWDQAETVLMRAMVGTGTRGLGAMRPRNGIWIRPLLWFQPNRLERHARRRSLVWAEDPTNRDRRYLRNRIRLDLLPAVLRTVGDAAPNALANLADRAGEDEELLTALAAEVADGARDAKGLRVEELAGQPRPLLMRILRDLAENEGGTPGSIHLALARGLVEGPDRSSGVDIPGGVRIERRGARIFARRRPAPLDREAGEFDLRLRGRSVWPATGVYIDARIHGDRTRVGVGVGAGARRAWFDLDRLTTPLRVHKFAAGLRMRPFGGPGSRKVAELMAVAGVPRELRRSWPVVSDDGTVIWVPGVRSAEVARVDAGTTRILDLSVGEGS